MAAKSSFEKALEKQQKEAKKLAEKEARTKTAASIVSGQPIVGGMRIMDASSEELLEIILDAYNGNENREVRGNDEIIPVAYHSSLSLEFEKLKMYGVVSDYCIWINALWEVTITPQGLLYFENKERAKGKERLAQKSNISIGSIVANGSNLVLGDVINSSLSVDNSIQRIEQEIEEKGGEDAEELHALLYEVKELIENIQESRHVPKNKGLFAKLSNHLEKHGWFYGEVIGLLGAAALQMLQG